MVLLASCSLASAVYPGGGEGKSSFDLFRSASASAAFSLAEERERSLEILLGMMMVVNDKGKAKLGMFMAV